MNIRVHLFVLFKLFRQSLTSHAVASLHFHNVIEFSIICAYKPALHGSHMVTKVKTECRSFGKCARFLTLICCSVRFTNILNENSFWEYFSIRIHISRNSKQMCHKYQFNIGVPLLEVSQMLQAKSKIVSINITKNRL